ncbi:HNH endonuclease, partial [Actinospica durhamensis]
PTSEGFQRAGRRLVVNETLLRAAVPHSTSIAEVIRRLGLEPSGPRHRAVREAIARLGLDTGHMLGQGHRRGAASGARLPPDKVLIFRPEQSYRRHSERVRIALLDLGVPERCAMCGTGPDWHGRRISLEIDHINADFRDNRRENLRFLCPNCHATTMSFCRKKALG